MLGVGVGCWCCVLVSRKVFELVSAAVFGQEPEGALLRLHPRQRAFDAVSTSPSTSTTSVSVLVLVPVLLVCPY